MLKQVNAVRSILNEDKGSSHLTPTRQDHDILESVAATLKPFKYILDALSGEIVSLFQQ